MQHETVCGLIVTAFTDVLGDAEVIDRDTDFFEVGGNSVLTARLVATLRGTLDVPVSMREVFVARTPAEIATRVLRKGGA